MNRYGIGTDLLVLDVFPRGRTYHPALGTVSLPLSGGRCAFEDVYLHARPRAVYGRVRAVGCPTRSHPPV